MTYTLYRLEENEPWKIVERIPIDDSDFIQPTIIDFGAGHSVYENPIMFYEFQKLISRFSNVVYMLPSEDKEESIKILNKRVIERNPNEPESSLNNNRHFVSINCNDRLSTIKTYTKDKSLEEICYEILKKYKKKVR